LASDVVQSTCDVEVHWHPFFLRPDNVENPKKRDGIVPGTMGTPTTPYWNPSSGSEYGIDMSGGVTRWPCVLHSHRLLHYAEKVAGPSVQHDLQGLIFKAFYTDDVYLGPENLARLAAKVGIDEETALSYLLSDEDEAEVKRQAYSYSRSGISGVPFFSFNGKPAFSGAQKPSSFVNAIMDSAMVGRDKS